MTSFYFFSWEKFDSLVTPEPNSGCWLWLGGVDAKGYGIIYKDGKSWRAHRLSFTRDGTPLVPSEVVMHKCDVRCCVNPAHLQRGTLSENFKDMWRKGRGRLHFGEHGTATRLTEQQVRKIFADVRPQSIVAREFGIARSTVTAIKRGAMWRHLNLLGKANVAR